MQTQITNPTNEDLITLSVPEITSNSTLFAGSNTGISCGVPGPFFSGLTARIVFLVGFFDVGCVVLAGVVWFISEVVLLVTLMLLSSAVEILVDAVDSCVGVISEDFPVLVGCTMKKLANKGI